MFLKLTSSACHNSYKVLFDKLQYLRTGSFRWASLVFRREQGMLLKEIGEENPDGRPPRMTVQGWISIKWELQ